MKKLKQDSKLARKKLVLQRDTVRVLASGLREVNGGVTTIPTGDTGDDNSQCTALETSCAAPRPPVA